MKTKVYVCNGMALALCLAAALSGQEAKEQKLKPKDVPAPVIAAAAKAYPNAKVRGWSKEMDAGAAQYEASMIEGTAKRDVVFAADGSVVAVEEIIPLADLPSAVKNAILAKYPRGVIHSAEKITKGTAVQYEVGLKNAAKKEVLLDSDGKVLKEE